jgi:translation initiation factor 3 subunit B
MTVLTMNIPEGVEKLAYLKTMSLDDVVLPEGDNMGIVSDDDDDEDTELALMQSFGNVIVVDNLPSVPEEKFGKLQNVVTKIFSQIGDICEGGLFMPKDAEGKTKGYCFVEFMDEAMANAALAQTQGYRLDKNHVFAVNKFDDFMRLSKVPDEYTPLAKVEHKPKENLMAWMMDDRGRDQFVLRYGDETEIFWNDGVGKRMDDVYKRSFWTESYVQWSPRGSTLTTIHRQGVAVWGGPGWARQSRLDHSAVIWVDWSPNEKYMFTCSTIEPQHMRDSATVLIKVFDMRAGTLVRTFQSALSDFVMEGDKAGLQWPVFKWAGGPGDKFFARMSTNQISVYETPSMQLLDKKSLKLEGVKDFEWSPTQDVLSVYQPEIGNQPARISLIQIPSRQELRQKNLFSVAEINMYWQSSGNYLAVKVERFTKTKKTTYHGFELFRVAEKGCPMEVLELENKSEKIVAFAWEPKGHRFAIIHGDGPRPDITFYTMEDKLGRVKKIGTLKGKSANTLYWSPQGKNVVLAGLKSLNGQLEFFNVDDFETLATNEHFMCQEVEWDPTGRYVTTSVTSVVSMENGFYLWAFNGKLLYKTMRDRFFKFSWRPRISSLLSDEQEQEIVKNLKTYSKKYDAMDEELKAAQDNVDMEEKRALIEEYAAWRQRKLAQLEAERPAYERLTAHLVIEETDSSFQEEVTVEEVTDVYEEVLNFAN